MKRTIICGDIHGSYKALLQCLERSNFDYENDTLIQLGDIVDGWNEVYECVEELLKIKNLISIKGNHDDWFNEFLKYGIHPNSWLQGGHGTLESYCNALGKKYTLNKGYITNMLDSDVPLTHKEFFNKQLKYYKDEDNNLFIHGGFHRELLLKNHPNHEEFWWNRDLWYKALSFKEINGKFKILESVKEIFIGHTTTILWKTDKPMNAYNIWNLDTGAGFKGKLTFMDLDTKVYWQSDEVSELYKDQKGRN